MTSPHDVHTRPLEATEDFGMTFTSHYQTIPLSDMETDTSATSTTSSNLQQDAIPKDNDIAVIGVACRVPGKNSAQTLWQYLLERKVASGEIPSSRWEPYFRRDPRNPEILSQIISRGYFLDRLQDFDSSFFGISPKEAEQMDPQQRISIEVAWEALEDAGIAPQSLAGSDTAVFMGVNTDDYSRLVLEDLPGIEAWMGVGTGFYGVPNRISYLLDLMGPSSAVDGACASSLVAIHHARQALVAEETSLVIAGGVNALIGPAQTRVLDQCGAISSDGLCRSFDESAAGYGRGEGAGIVILKRKADALRAQDRILAILKGSAVAADGRTNGIMAPNPIAQEKVAHKALETAGIPAASVSYVEAHATSTSIGDPIECLAMANVYGHRARQPTSSPCLIGSIKPNIGHLEAGAGVLGFIKAVMIVQYGMIPPQANLETLNSKVDWEKLMLRVVQEPTRWPENDYPRRAAISSYGYGGTVSHAVIEEAAVNASHVTPPFELEYVNRPTLLLLSAPLATRIPRIAKDFSCWLEVLNDRELLSSVAFTLANKRGHHTHRVAIIAENSLDAVKKLNDLSDNLENEWIYNSNVLSKNVDTGAVWVYSGHGAQWKGMGRTFMESEPPFLDVLRQLDPVIRDEMDFSIIETFKQEDVHTSDVIQVLTYVMHIGITAVLRSKGATPSAVIGHSMGEIAAAVTAGALTVQEGAVIACARARLCQSVAGLGKMLLVNVTYEEAVKELAERDNISAAIDSSPSSCVVSGSVEAIDEVNVMWKAKGIPVHVIQSDIAFHSQLLLPLAKPFRALLDGRISPNLPAITLYSTSLRNDPRGKALRDPEYWVNNLLKPVLLTSTISAAIEDRHRIFLEVSSHPIVTHSISEILLDNQVLGGIAISTMHREKEVRKSMLLALGKLHCVGNEIDLKLLLKGEWIHEVPRTSWDHQPYWREVETASFQPKASHNAESHCLLGNRTPLFGANGMLWESYLDEEVKPFPGNHFVRGSEIVPAAVLLNTFLSATSSCSLLNVSLRVPVMTSPSCEVQVLTQHNRLRLSTRILPAQNADQIEQSWVTNTTANIDSAEKPFTVCKFDIADIWKRLDISFKPSFTIDYLLDVGVKEMGFPWIVISHRGTETEMLVEIDVGPTTGSLMQEAGSSWAPILDAATSVSSVMFHREPKLRMLAQIHCVTVRPIDSVPRVSFVYVKRSTTMSTVDAFICSKDGTTFAELQNMRFSGLDGTHDEKKDPKGLVYQLAWPPVQLAETPLFFRYVLFIANESQLLDSYQTHLSRVGIDTNTISGLQSFKDVPEDTIIIHIPDQANSRHDIYDICSQSCKTLLDTIKVLVDDPSAPKLFCITGGVANGQSWSALGHASLHGLARIIQSEHPDVWGGLIDIEEGDFSFPSQAIKYAKNHDVIRVHDSVAQTARLRPLDIKPTTTPSRSMPMALRVESTYLITGGLGALGLEIAAWMVEKGAQRIILVSRRILPLRSQWCNNSNNQIIQKILALEALGATVHLVRVDLSTSQSADHLRSRLEQLSVPPIAGVVHAAGVIEDQLITKTTSVSFNRVIAPKVIGAMVLDELFPPKSLDFFILFSSCGQLFGFPGQAAYASGNAFLDCLATRRRALGDNAVSMMWTSWRGLGMGASTKYLDAELAIKGITDITKNEAFRAWDLVASQNTDHAVVLRCLTVNEDEPTPHPILSEIWASFERRVTASASKAQTEKKNTPLSVSELHAHVTDVAIECVMSTLGLTRQMVDIHVALSELGLDSIMNVGLRSKLQQALKVTVSPTTIWSHPTIADLASYLAKKLAH